MTEGSCAAAVACAGDEKAALLMEGACVKRYEDAAADRDDRMAGLAMTCFRAAARDVSMVTYSIYQWKDGLVGLGCYLWIGWLDINAFVLFGWPRSARVLVKLLSSESSTRRGVVCSKSKLSSSFSNHSLKLASLYDAPPTKIRKLASQLEKIS